MGRLSNYDLCAWIVGNFDGETSISEAHKPLFPVYETIDDEKIEEVKNDMGAWPWFSPYNFMKSISNTLYELQKFEAELSRAVEKWEKGDERLRALFLNQSSLYMQWAATQHKIDTIEWAINFCLRAWPESRENRMRPITRREIQRALNGI